MASKSAQLALVLLLRTGCNWAQSQRTSARLTKVSPRLQKHMRLDLESNPTVSQVFSNDIADDVEVPATTERLLKKGVAAAQSGDRDQARKLLTQVVAIDPASVDAWMWL